MDQLTFMFHFSFPRVELEDVFKKLQKTSGVSIKKVSASKASYSLKKPETHAQNEIFLEEYENIKIKEEVQEYLDALVEVPVENMLQDEVPVEDMLQDDNADHYHDDEDDESIKETFDEDDEPSEIDSDENSDQNYVPSSSKLIQKTTAPVRRKTPASVELVIDGPIAFSCIKCKNQFDTFNELVNHMRTKDCFTDEFTCDICPKQFQNRRSLNRHKTTHKPKLKLMCEECAKTFSNKFDLDMHKQSFHNHAPNKNSKLIFKCNHCTEQFSNHLDLFTHVKEHAREKKEGPKLCETCGKNLCNLKSYQAHIKTHGDVVKNFVCPVCNKRFSKGFLLAQHSHVHTGIKMYKCNSCDKAFAKRDSLKLHNKKYHQEESTPLYNYTCEDCKIGFKSFEHFKTHVAKCNSR